MSQLRARVSRNYANGRLHLLSRLRTLWHGIAAKTGRLLRVLFLRFGAVSPGAARAAVLRSVTGVRPLLTPGSHYRYALLRFQAGLVRLAPMFRRNLLILLAAVWVILPPLAQACATHCAMQPVSSTSGLMHDAQSIPGCPGGATGGTSHSDGSTMSGLCMFAASAAMSMSFASIPVQVTTVEATSDASIFPSLTTLPPDKPPRS